MKKLIVLACILLAASAYGGTRVYPVTTESVALFSAIGNATGGDYVVLSVNSGNSVSVSRVDFKPQANISGTVAIKLGSTTIYSITNVVAGNVYGVNFSPNYVLGSDGADIILNAPTATINYNVHYWLN